LRFRSNTVCESIVCPVMETASLEILRRRCYEAMDSYERCAVTMKKHAEDGTTPSDRELRAEQDALSELGESKARIDRRACTAQIHTLSCHLRGAVFVQCTDLVAGNVNC
jgi:hypothetical protein